MLLGKSKSLIFHDLTSKISDVSIARCVASIFRCRVLWPFVSVAPIISSTREKIRLLLSSIWSANCAMRSAIASYCSVGVRSLKSSLISIGESMSCKKPDARP